MIRRHFNRTKLEFPGTSSERYVIGIAVGIIFWLVFSLFLIGCRESMRIVFSIAEDNYLWILSKRETWFFNFISSMFASSLGLSICLKHWYEKPNLDSDPNFNYRRKGIINDISGLNAYVASVISKLVFVLAIWSGTFSLHVKYKFYPDGNFIWILILVVMFLEQWKTIRRVFRNRANRAIIVSATISTIGSAIIAFWAPLDLEKVDKILISNSIPHNYTYIPVTSNQTVRIQNRSLVTDLYFLYPKGQNPDQSIMPDLFTKMEQHYSLDQIQKLVNLEREYIDPKDQDQHTFLIHVDYRTPLLHIKKVHNELIQCGIKRIFYSSLPENSPLPYISGNPFGTQIQYNYFINNDLQDQRKTEEDKNNTILIKVMSLDLIYINGREVSLSQVEMEVLSYYRRAANWDIRILYSDSITFQDYIKIIEIQHLRE
jgi:hypothetical protein